MSTRTVAWISIGCICVHEQSICFGCLCCPLMRSSTRSNVLFGAQATIVASVLHEGPRQPERYSDDAFPGLSLGFSWINGATHERYAFNCLSSISHTTA